MIMQSNQNFHGYRISISAIDAHPGVRHFSGSNSYQNGSVFISCPCCNYEMFPAINLDFSDPKLTTLDLWDPVYMNVLFCPFCGLYMSPYWICYGNDTIEIVGGDRSSVEIFQNIETPYLMREITLHEMGPEEDPRVCSKKNDYYMRSLGDGVYHQIGGFPIKGNANQLSCCKCLKNMAFAGILDYDDLNVPLYENDHIPVSLIIGDGDCLNFYTCKTCKVIGLSWVR
ncbi:MAG: hypothetical protein KDC71_24825 [Acidobacteria bacterium]|nr:hypothetical protein [Acidobacteriota bacterium]